MFSDKRILTIDDSTTIRNHLRRVLTTLGALVEGAETGEEGLNKWRHERFDLILIDLLLPDTDGIEILKTIRAEDEYSTVVVLTGTGGIKSATAALQQGADGFLEKQDMVAGDQTTFFYSLEKAFERRTNLVTQRRLQGEIAEKVEQLKVSEQVAIEASRAKSTFLANMSHELRTPLNAILGFVQIMERDAGLTDQQRKNLEIILRSGEHLLALINDVLSLSKIEAGKVSLHAKGFDIHRLLQGLEEMLGVRARSKGIKLVFSLSPDFPRYVCGDEGKIRQILINLLGNAVKFTDSGGVILRANWKADRAFFEIEDTGPGIAPEEIGKLFEPFMQTQSGQKSREGTGLGLALSRNFVRLSGGDIHVRSRVGEGTTFSLDIHLPGCQSEEPDERTRKVVGVKGGRRPFRMLVIDDQWEGRAVLSTLLASVGFEVEEADGGEAGIALLEPFRPELVWLDLRMPGMDGFETAKAIRRLEGRGTTIGESGRVPIIAVTASAFDETKETALAAGCDDFVAKPYSEASVFEKIARYLPVEFEFADIVQSPQAHVAAPEKYLTRERLATLPTEISERLRNAVAIGDITAAEQTVERLAIEDERLARELSDMISRYQFDEIEELLT